MVLLDRPPCGAQQDLGVFYNPTIRMFTLSTTNTTYAFRVDDARNLEHLYYGQSVPKDDDITYLRNSNDSVVGQPQYMPAVTKGPQDRSVHAPSQLDRSQTRRALSATGVRDGGTPFLGSEWNELDSVYQRAGKYTQLLEFSDRGTGDTRSPSISLRYNHNGNCQSPFEYKEHFILNGKAPIPGPLPGLYTLSQNECTTLKLVLQDPNSKLEVYLFYSVFHELDVITRRVEVSNTTSYDISLERIMSATLDLPADTWYWTQLTGTWGRERHMQCQRIEMGFRSVGSTRGSSGHEANPFVAISRENEISENFGDVYGLMLVYSGDFTIEAERQYSDRVRIHIGINPEEFSWHLAPGATFASPETILCFSSTGSSTLSHRYHTALTERLMPRRWLGIPCPVLLNTWEGIYFDLNHDKVVRMAEKAQMVGVEMLVMDDGWFTNRLSETGETGGLGDWAVDETKLIHGLPALVNAVNSTGLKFGIWIEPEMVSKNSALYGNHPEWCLAPPKDAERPMTIARTQYVLNLGLDQVVDYIFEVFNRLLSTSNIEYIKWDFNRAIAEYYSPALEPCQQRESHHRYILGLYRLLSRVTTAFPDVRIEGCAAGGGRFDAGMLSFVPQIWTSDCTDPKERIFIQQGTSLAYPIQSMGTHVSNSPNHQTNRSFSLTSMSFVAMTGTYGLELNPIEWSECDIKNVEFHVSLYKKLRSVVYKGQYYRLWNARSGAPRMAWMMVSQDKKQAFVVAIAADHNVGRSTPHLRLRGLDESVRYEIEHVLPPSWSMCPTTGQPKKEPGMVYRTELNSGKLEGHLPSAKNLVATGQTLHRTGLSIRLCFEMDVTLLRLEATQQGTLLLGPFRAQV